MKQYDITKDYIMNKELSHFDNYNKYDIMGIEYDLNSLLNDNEIPYDIKLKIADKYDGVIKYIKIKLLERGEL